MAFIRVFGLFLLQFLFFLQVLIVMKNCNLGFFLVFLPCSALKCIKKAFFRYSMFLARISLIGECVNKNLLIHARIL